MLAPEKFAGEKSTRLLGLLFAVLGLAGCNPEPTEDCTLGSEGCMCAGGNMCFSGLECVAGVCQSAVADEAESDSMETSADESSESAGAETGDGDTTTTTGDGDTSTTTGDGDTTTTSTDGGCEAGLTMCGGECVDTLSDDSNCGECGTVCKVVFGQGNCVEGSCEPTMSECIDVEGGVTPCTEVCANEGLACVEGGCPFGTVNWFLDLTSCETNLPKGTMPYTCDGPDDVQGDAYRCCCAQ